MGRRSSRSESELIIRRSRPRRVLVLSDKLGQPVARTIVSIAAAPGWAARYYDEDGEKVVTLLAWALVEDDSSRSLVGFVQKPATLPGATSAMVLADEVDGFDGYTSGALVTRPTG
jgi:hypothetical protein